MLLTPGPTPVPEFVRKAMSDVTIHHRTPEFEAIFKETRTLLLELFDMDDCVILSSSGTGAMEACVTNLCHQKALVVNSGKFGERFGKICEAFDLEYTQIKHEWNEPVRIEEIEKALEQDPTIDAVCIQICESSGGLRHPVEEVARRIKEINPSICVIADGITALGVEKIDSKHLDALITGSQKALMLPPGLAMVGLSHHAVAKIESRSHGYYLNLFSEIKKQRQYTTAYTAATTLIIGLRAILLRIKAIGFDCLYTQTAQRSLASRKALEAIGLSIYPNVPAYAMTTIYSEESNAIRTILKEKYHVNIAGGQDHLKGKIFRINHMGLVEDYETSWTLNAVEMALDELNIRSFSGTANKVFLESLIKKSDVV